MLNFYHEIKLPPDRHVRAFLCHDYFHDSVIDSIRFEERLHTLYLRLWCDREWSDDVASTNHCRENYGVGRLRVPNLASEQVKAARWPDSPFYSNYRYALSFQHCAGCDISLDTVWCRTDYLNGRFKDSVRLRDVQRRTKRRHFHFRIHTANGFIDVIFRKFEVRREIGSVRLQAWPAPGSCTLQVVPRGFRGKPRAAVVRALSDPSEYERGLALRTLYVRRDKEVVRLACGLLQHSLQLEEFDIYDEGLLTGVYVLGVRGSAEHLPRLEEVRSRSSDLAYRRHVQDAIDRIAWRVFKKGAASTTQMTEAIIAKL